MLTRHKLDETVALELELINLADKLFPGYAVFMDKKEVRNIIHKFILEFIENKDTYRDTTYRKDVRTDEQKLKDLLVGWALEDMILEFLNTKRVKSVLNQSFEGRIVQNMNNISEIDFLIKLKNRNINVELKTIATSLDDSGGVRIKLSNWENYKRQKALILIYHIPESKFSIINPSDNKWRTKKSEKFFPWGNKEVYRFTPEELRLIKIEDISNKYFEDLL